MEIPQSNDAKYAVMGTILTPGPTEQTNRPNVKRWPTRGLIGGFALPPAREPVSRSFTHARTQGGGGDRLQ